MRKQSVLSSLFLVSGLLLSSVQAADLDDLEVCPLFNGQKNEDAKVNPLRPDKDLNNEEELKVGYKCKTLGVETESYRPDGHVQWTLVKKDGGKQIWAAHTKWGPIYVGYVETGVYSFSEAKRVCNKYENIVLEGKTYQIKMTLPEIGFRKAIRNSLNFELLESLNYTSVISNEEQIQVHSLVLVEFALQQRRLLGIRFYQW